MRWYVSHRAKISELHHIIIEVQAELGGALDAEQVRTSDHSQGLPAQYMTAKRAFRDSDIEQCLSDLLALIPKEDSHDHLGRLPILRKAIQNAVKYARINLKDRNGYESYEHVSKFRVLLRVGGEILRDIREEIEIAVFATVA